MYLSCRRIVSFLTLTALATTLNAVVAVSPASAATTLNVTTTADVGATAGACGNTSIVTPPSPMSLREAVCLADNIGGDVVINVPAGRYLLGNGELRLGRTPGQSVSVIGAGAASTIVDGDNASRVFNVDQNEVGGISTTFASLTITRGRADTVGGAAILAGAVGATPADSLSLNGVVVIDNVSIGAANPGGGVQMFGGRLTVSNSTFSTNRSTTLGSALYYQSVGGTNPDGLTIVGSTFAGNQVNTSAGSGLVGGAVATAGTASSTYTIANSRFANNAVLSTGGGRAVGGAVFNSSGALTVLESTFTGNTTAANAGGVGAAVYSSGPAVLHYNRIIGNTGATVVEQSGGTMNATDNWWGCNAGPNNTGCEKTGGTVVTSPRLVLSGSASPARVTGPNATSTITGSLVVNSAGANVGTSNLDAFQSLPVTFSDPPGDATVTTNPGSHTSPVISGRADIDYHSGSVSGPSPVGLTFDNATVNTSVQVDRAPGFTSPSSASFVTGRSGSFTVTTTGYPTPTISGTGALPSGLSFTDNRDGTATLAGTPTGGGGTYPFTLTASNGADPAATQTLTVSVGQAPAFTSPSTATFRIGAPGSFTVTTAGTPRVDSITESGALPPGLTFTDNGDGTATLAGTPTGSGRTYPVTLTATNGVSPNAAQSLTIQVNQAPAVTSNPSDQTVQPGTSVTFSAAASGVPTPRVQWQRSTGGGSFLNIGGATSTSYTHTASAEEDGYAFRAVFTNSSGTATTTAATLRVGSAPAFTSVDTTRFVVGAAGSFDITTAGRPDATLSRVGAQFPPWLTLTDNGDGTGALTGTPPAGSGGAYTFTLKATNGFSPSASQTFTLVVDQSPMITSTGRATFVAGVAGSFTVTTTAGYPTSTEMSRSGALPSGVSFVDNGDGTGTLSGTPTAGSGGSYAVSFTASNGGTAPSAIQSFTLTVLAPPRITSSNRATFTAGVAGSFTVTTEPGNPAAMSLSKSGALPSGVTFADNGDGTATLAGTPGAGAGGVYPLTLTASNGVAPNSTQTFTLTVNEAPRITSASRSTFRVGTAGAFTVTTADGQPATTTITQTGSLPAGVTFVDNGDGTAVLAGTATEGGIFPLTITASNGVQPDATQSFVLTVNGPPAITSADHTTFRVGALGTFTVTTAAGHPVPRTISRTGTLPAGVTFVDNGDGTATLQGTPADGTGGSYALALTASNGISPDAVQSITLTVEEPSAITSADRASFEVGTPGTFTITTSDGFPESRTITATGSLPPGVTFTDDGDGAATLAGTPAGGAAGAYPLTITVTNAGDSADQEFVLTVTKRAQTITTTSTVPDPAVVGASYRPSATATSALPVTIAIDDDATTDDACNLVDGRVFFDHVGHCRVVYTQPGDGTWAAAPAMADDFEVSATGTAVVVTPQAGAVYGQPTAVTAAVTAGDVRPAGTVRFAIDGQPVGAVVAVDAGGRATSPALSGADGGPLEPGSHAVTVTFTPDDPSSTTAPAPRPPR